MSTKTTLKRVALVAVAATGFGLLSVVPSSAAVHQADTLTIASTTASTTIGTPVSVVLTQSYIAAATETLITTASINSSPAGSSVLPVLTAAGGTPINGSAGISGLISTTTPTGAGYTSTFTTATLTPTHSGTYIIKFTPGLGSSTGVIQASALIWTVTVAAVPAITAANSTSFVNAGQGTTFTADEAIAAAKAAVVTTGGQKATIKVTSMNSVPTDLSASTTLSATISGPGTLGFNSVPANMTSTGRAITGTVGQQYVGVFSDGTAGTATITISAGTLVLGTETVVFYGSISAIATTVVNPVIATTNVGGSATGAITAIAKDSNGNAVAGSTLYITSSDLTVLNASYLASTGVTDGTGKATFNLPVGLKAGTVNLTVGNGTDAATTTVSAGAVSVRVGSETPASVVVTFDKASYVLGEKATVTVALLDSTGAAVANGTYANVFAAGGLVSNFALTGDATNVTSITTSGSAGTKTFTVFLPSYQSDIVLSATGGTGLPAAAQVALTSTTASVSNSASDAATDAANAATDAANYAADAADAATTAAEEATAAANDAADAAAAAQESADAATAAVVELSTKVSALVDSLRAQITSLGNYVAKVAAALGRVGTALNKVLAKK